MTLSSVLIRSTIVAALGGLLFGFDTAVISGTTGALSRTFALSAGGLGITVASALWGTILGAMFAGFPGERFGRRDSLRGTAVLYVASALGCALAWDWNALIFFRMIGGLAIGASSVLGPLYIAEIAPAKWRGRLVGFFQFNVVAGILVAYLSNYLIGLTSVAAAGTDAEWRWKLGVTALPAVLFLGMLFTIPRSPRWLAARGRTVDAREVLRQIGEEDVDAALRQITTTTLHDSKQGTDALFQAKYRLPIFLAIAIGMFNQLSGINAILYYLNDIFAKAGFDKVSGDLQAVAVGATNLIFTVIGMSIIDYAGRKKLLLAGSVGTAVCLGGVAAVFASGSHENLLVWLLIGFIAFFAFSQGAVIWVYLSEVFPTPVRAKGQSLGSFTHWIMNAAIAGVFPVMAAWSKSIPFVFFAAMMAVQFFVVLFVFPETKGVALEKMQEKLSHS
jgi:sugar porter (SP) family MFS transporter